MACRGLGVHKVRRVAGWQMVRVSGSSLLWRRLGLRRLQAAKVIIEADARNGLLGGQNKLWRLPDVLGMTVSVELDLVGSVGGRFGERKRKRLM